ncbi:MAG: sugar phosphate isomerase/epimerase [Clostridia bacterium]|nr:sugar phosphate isomerase/epimerase [Clostridia bacterium]
MKLSFSTGGWPFSLDECASLAREMRYDGLEISARSLPVFERSGAPLSPGRLHDTVRRLNEASLSIAALQATADWTQDEALSLIALAHDLRSPFVVIPMGETGAEAEEKISAVLPVAEKAGVALLVPTAGPYADTGILKSLLDGFASDFLGAVWRVPAAAAKKSPEEIVTDLGAYIRHVYLCDGEIVDGEAQEKLLSEGKLPLKDVFAALRSISFDGFFSFDWTPGDGALGDADVVLSHYAALARNLGKDPRRARHTLYDNNRKTGKYVWKKDILIEETFPSCWTAWWRNSPISTLSATPPWITPAPMPSSGTTWTIAPGR